MARTPNYVVGRGRLFFEQFLNGSRVARGAERYLGNSPELSLSQSEETLDHFNSDEGIRVKDASISLQNDLTGSFTLDDISPENLALWFRGVVAASVIAGGAGLTHAATDVALGTYVQLGVDADNPTGDRNVSDVTASSGATPVVAEGNFTVDPATGRVFIHDDAAGIADGDDITFTYTVGAGTAEMVIPAGTNIEGRLVFIAANAAGENRDYVWPLVRMTPDGDFALKGDDWQTVNFSFEVLKLNDVTERQYIRRR